MFFLEKKKTPIKLSSAIFYKRIAFCFQSNSEMVFVARVKRFRRVLIEHPPKRKRSQSSLSIYRSCNIFRNR